MGRLAYRLMHGVKDDAQEEEDMICRRRKEEREELLPDDSECGVQSTWAITILLGNDTWL